MKKLIIPLLVVGQAALASAQNTRQSGFESGVATSPSANSTNAADTFQSLRVTKTQLEALATRLREVEAQKQNILSNKIKSSEFESIYMAVQKETLDLMQSLGIKAKSIAQYDYHGLPVSPMFRKSNREAQEEIVITSTGNLEVGLARILPNIEVLADAKGPWANRLANQLNRRGVRVVVTPGAIDDVGGASYSSSGKYIRLPLGDVLSGGITFQTQHELKHMHRDLQVDAGKSTIFDIDISGDAVSAALKGTPYQGGFSIDELRAYPSGAYAAATLADHAPQSDTPFIINSGNKGWQVIDAKRHGSSVIEIKRTPEFILNAIRQSSESADQFSMGLDQMFAAPITWTQDLSKLQLMVFFDDSLIVTPPKSDVRMTISQPEAEGLSNSVLLTINDVNLKYNISAKYSERIRQAVDLANSSTGSVPKSTQKLIADLQLEAQKLVGELSSFVASYKPLNAKLKAAVEAQDVEKANKALLEINHLVKTYEARGLNL